MNTYEILFPGGRNRAIMIMTYLGGFGKLSDAGRPRDGWIERDRQHRFLARLMTRNGSGDYMDATYRLRAHPLYVRDENSSFETTYVSFWFKLPIDLDKDLEEWLETVAVDPVMDDERHWSKAVARRVRFDPEPCGCEVRTRNESVS